MRENDINSVDSRRLSELMRPHVSSQEDLAAELREQLATPLATDLEPALFILATHHMNASDWQARLTSYAELFADPRPPIAILEATKRFAKAHREHGSSLLPPEVATVLYFAAIAAAEVRCDRRITELADEKLREGLRWCIEREWVDDAMRTLLVEAAGRVSSRA